MRVEAGDIVAILKKFKIATDAEALTQKVIETIMLAHRIDFKREHQLDKKNRPDFFVTGGLVVEVKIRGTNTSREIYKQLERYAQFDEVTELLLVTGKAMGMPAEINGKKVTMMSLGRQLL